MGIYKTGVEVTDFGPYVTRLFLDIGQDVGALDILPGDFEVYVERKNAKTGGILRTKEPFERDKDAEPARGIRRVIGVYPCDSEGGYKNPGQWVALEMDTDGLGKMIEEARFSKNEYKITYIKSRGFLTEGTVFEESAGMICPQLDGWGNAKSLSGSIPLNYGYYTPRLFADESGKLAPLPLVIWLHGAGEGGVEPTVAYTGNKAAGLSSKDIQGKLGGQAWVMAPQCPTVWMDDGKEYYGHSNTSIYTASLKACIDEFIKKRPGLVDMSRIYLGGCSNGGFMTVRRAIDYPDFFAAIFPVCEAFFEENLTPEVIKNLKEIPCWLVHARGDALVDPEITAVPLYKKLLEAGAKNVHFTYFDSMDDELARFWKVSLPPHAFDHGVWVKVYNDQCHTDFDGGQVVSEGRPATLFEWLGHQKR